MNTTYTDKHIDEFGAWLRANLPVPQTNSVTRLVPKALLDKAFEVARAHQSYFIANGDYQATFFLKAAADGSQQNAPIEIESDNQQWSLTREDIPGTDEKILRLACDVDWIETFKGRSIEIYIGEHSYHLGKINRRGVAETKIPSGLNFLQKIEITIR